VEGLPPGDFVLNVPRNRRSIRTNYSPAIHKDCRRALEIRSGWTGRVLRRRIRRFFVKMEKKYS